MDRFPKPIEDRAPGTPSKAHYVVWIVLIVAAWVYQWFGGMLYGAESHCLGELPAILMLIVAPLLQLATLIASAVKRSKRWVFLCWGSLAAFGLYWITYASTLSGPYC